MTEREKREGNRRQIHDMIIIGGGPAGCMAAICCKRLAAGARVAVVETGGRVLRKLLASGNGQCNFTNIHMDESHYHGRDGSFARSAITSFPPGGLFNFMEGLGVLATAREDGRAYPLSMNAASVVDAIRFEMERLGIEILTDTRIESVRHDGGFVLEHAGGRLRSRMLLVAAGGSASPALGGCKDGCDILAWLGHSLNAPSPVLVQVKTEDGGLHGLKGLKAECSVDFMSEGETLERVSGELLFTDYGLSGPPIFYLSKYCHFHKRLTARIDFFPQYMENELIELLKGRRETLAHLPLAEFLSGMMNKRISQAVMKRAGLGKLSRVAGTLTVGELRVLAVALKDTRSPITGTTGFKNAQAAAGGVDTRGFSPETMESLKVPGLFAAGEVLDIFGDCGGYNLHWAFASGRMAGEAAARKFF